MRKFLLLLSILLFPLRIFGYGADVFTLWTNRDTLLAAGLALLGSGGGALAAFVREYPWPVVGLFATGGLLLALWLVAGIIEGYRRKQAKRRLAPERQNPGHTYNIENVYVSPQNRDQSPAEQAPVVAKEYNRGPVSIPEDEPYVLEHPRYIGSDAPIVCLVPYKAHEARNSRFSNPAATIKAESAEDAYFIVVSYEVRSFAEHYSTGSSMMPINVRVQVLDERTKVVGSLDIHRGDTSIAPDGSWRHVVSGSAVLSGLSEGVYGLNVLDYVTVFGHRKNARREYREMRLRVTRQ